LQFDKSQIQIAFRRTAGYARASARRANPMTSAERERNMKPPLDRGCAEQLDLNAFGFLGRIRGSRRDHAMPCHRPDG